jgi:hypothetical protein
MNDSDAFRCGRENVDALFAVYIATPLLRNDRRENVLISNGRQNERPFWKPRPFYHMLKTFIVIFYTKPYTDVAAKKTTYETNSRYLAVLITFLRNTGRLPGYVSPFYVGDTRVVRTD